MGKGKQGENLQVQSQSQIMSAKLACSSNGCFYPKFIRRRVFRGGPYQALVQFVELYWISGFHAIKTL